MSVDIGQIMKRYSDKVEKGQQVGKNVWEFWIRNCPNNPLKIKVVRARPADARGKFEGIANYGIKSSSQVGPYWSVYPRTTEQEAVEEALRGFLMYYDPKQAQDTKYEPWKDW